MFKQKFVVSNLNRRVIAQFMEGNKEWINAGPRFSCSHQFHRDNFQLQVIITKEKPKARPWIVVSCQTDDPKQESEAKDIASRIQSIIKSATKNRKANTQ